MAVNSRKHQAVVAPGRISRAPGPPRDVQRRHALKYGSQNDSITPSTGETATGSFGQLSALDREMPIIPTSTVNKETWIRCHNALFRHEPGSPTRARAHGRREGAHLLGPSPRSPHSSRRLVAGDTQAGPTRARPAILHTLPHTTTPVTVPDNWLQVLLQCACTQECVSGYGGRGHRHWGLLHADSNLTRRHVEIAAKQAGHMTLIPQACPRRRPSARLRAGRRGYPEWPCAPVVATWPWEIIRIERALSRLEPGPNLSACLALVAQPCRCLS